MTQLIIPARYWDDFSERAPVDSPEQLANEVRRAGNRVTIEADPVQLKYLLGDAEFYAQGNTDDTPTVVIRGAVCVAEMCRAILSNPNTPEMTTTATKPIKLSEAQKRVMKWIGKGWTTEPGPGSTVYVNGSRICNTDTMMTLYRAGLAEKDGRGCWSATPAGKGLTKELGL